MSLSSFIFAEKIAIQVYLLFCTFIFLFKQASKKTTKMLSSSSFARASTSDQTQTVILLLPQAALLPGSDMAFFVTPASSFVIRSRQISCSVQARLTIKTINFYCTGALKHFNPCQMSFC